MSEIPSRRRRWSVTLFCCAVFACVSWPASADSIIAGTDAGSPNAYPFAGSAYTGEYQQLYDHVQFSGPAVLHSLAFSSASNVGMLNANLLNVQLSLAILDGGATGLASNFTRNLGNNSSLVFAKSFWFQPQGTDSFDLRFDIAPFLYDPFKGDLLLDIQVSGTGSPNFFRTTQDGVLSRAYLQAGHGEVKTQDNYGLLTKFDLDYQKAVTAVPEPASVLLSAGAFASLAAFKLRRHRKGGIA